MIRLALRFDAPSATFCQKLKDLPPAAWLGQVVIAVTNPLQQKAWNRLPRQLKRRLRIEAMFRQTRARPTIHSLCSPE